MCDPAQSVLSRTYLDGRTQSAPATRKKQPVSVTCTHHRGPSLWSLPLAQVEEEGAELVGREKGEEALQRARDTRVGGDIHFLVPQLREHVVDQNLTLFAISFLK